MLICRHPRPPPPPNTHTPLASTQISIMPFDVIGFFFKTQSVNKLKGLRIVRLLRLMKLVRVAKASR